MRKLYKHQQHLVDLNPKKWLLAHEVGSGKSITVLELIKKNELTPLIICPKAMVERWFEYLREYNIGGIVLSKETFKKRVKELPWYNCVVVDEGHYFFGYKSQLFKLLKAFLEHWQTPHVYILTGTPYMSTSFNIWCAGVLLGQQWKWWDWKKKYFAEISMGHRKIPVERKTIDGVQVKDILAGIINKLGNTVTLEDCFDVPSQIYELELLDLTTGQIRAIDDLLDVLPIVRFTKIHQICGGSLKGDEYTEDQYYKSDKLDRLLEYISLNNKVAVVCRYNNEIYNLSAKISEKYPAKRIFIINGESKDRHQIVKDVEATNDCVVLIQAACSEGYGLGSIPLMIFYSLDFSLKNYIQMKGRIQRADNIKKNVYIHLVVKDTIDHDIYKKVVIEKQDFHLTLYAKN
jgi:hypothetical protein